MCHTRDRENRLCLYVGIMIHAKMRNKDLIDQLFKLGISVSYDRVLTLSTDLANAVIDYFNEDNVVCPPQLRKGLFTVSAFDNFDHNPSATSAKKATHGTSISIFQEQTEGCEGTERAKASVHPKGNDLSAIKALPDRYSVVPASALQRKHPPIPPTDGCARSEANLILDAMSEEYRWLQHMNSLLKNEDLPEELSASWSAFNAVKHGCPPNSTFISAIMPLFYEQAKSVAMIQHGMNVIKDATHILNPNQIPVIAMDQPLFALAKEIQWDKPEIYGEGKFLIMFGGLHIELAAFKTLGDWMKGSGWPEAISKANVASSGTADSFLKATHIARTRHAHQVTAAAMYSLLVDAYTTYQALIPEEETALDFQEWCDLQSEKSPQFKFWYVTIEFQLIIFIFIKSIRLRNFALYKEALGKLLPWFFALDHHNYSRWLSVHARYMACLPSLNPEINQEFENGKFALAKTGAPFSAIAIDHAHEQNNGVMKGEGGTIGLTETPSALKRWMVAGPEMARLVHEFEEDMDIDTKHVSMKHHEQTPSKQKTFVTEVRSLAKKVEEMGNPFLETGKDLYKLDTKDVADEDVVQTVEQIKRLGEEKYSNFVKERLIDRTVPICEPIKRNKLPLFSKPPVKVKSKTQFEIATLKSNCSLFSRLYVSCLSRASNLEYFFSHENQAYPPSLTSMGEIRSNTKSDLVDCVTEDVTFQQLPEFEAAIIDGAAIVNMVQPIAGQTFQQYAREIIIPFVISYEASRIDVVWDVYIENSLKEHTRNKRGKGKRRKVTAITVVPQNWPEFLRDSTNKTELFEYLGGELVGHQCEKLIVTTVAEKAVTNKPDVLDISDLQPCLQEEADSRLLLHAHHARTNGKENILIRTVDTDVLVIAIAMVHKLGPGQLWLLFGKGNTSRFISVNSIQEQIGLEKSMGLPIFHAFTGCDTVSSFAGIGKKTAWRAWKACSEMDNVFASLAENPSSIDDYLSSIERFVVVCYNRVSENLSVNEERKYLFTKKGRDVNSIPPTQGALHEHSKHAVFQGGHCWYKALSLNPRLPCPSNWGWKMEGGQWKPVWTRIEEASKALNELIKCGCKQTCISRCKCKKAGLQCTALCACEDSCGQEN